MKRRGHRHDEPVARHRSGGNPDDAGEAAARRRVETVLEAMTRVDLQVIVVALPDATRLAAEDRARDAAIVAGRGQLLHDATGAARDATIELFARAGFNGTWALTRTSVSVATSDDRVAAAAAFEEAAMAAVVEDLLDVETLDVLRSTADEYDRFGGLPSPGSLSALGTPVADTFRGPVQVAIVAVFVVFCLAAGLAVGSVTGVVIVVLGIAVVTAMARRYSQPGD
jgi:hypothetical protein